MEKLRWGVLSTAKIGLEKVIPAMQAGAHSQVVGIASRDLGRAEAAARWLGIPRAYGSYEALLASPDVDAVYIPLPNHLHVPWSIKALEAGKHVLCEKPIGLSTGQARELQAAAHAHPNLKVMEAFMYRFHPQWQRTKQIVAEGGVGELRTVQSFFAYYNVDPDNIRNQADVGGGALMDIGCYCLSLARFLFDAEPARVMGIVERDPTFGTDRLTAGILDFGVGTSTFTCATQLAPFQRVNIVGTTGRVEIEIPFNAPPDCGCRVWHQHDDEVDAIELAPANQYTIQGDFFSLAVIENRPVPTPLDDAVANMAAIEAVVASAEQGSWIVPG
ncbi:MAG: Gfo/Idh/MocA family oxidoreductase [Anaerolineae bacterium]|nr:Gfo/Idh/MocA family oxidoreductase [Anaerolineae bacterium]